MNTPRNIDELNFKMWQTTHYFMNRGMVPFIHPYIFIDFMELDKYYNFVISKPNHFDINYRLVFAKVNFTHAKLHRDQNKLTIVINLCLNEFI